MAAHNYARGVVTSASAQKNSRRSEGEYNLRLYVATSLEETQEGSP